MKEYYIGLIDERGEVVIDLNGKIDLISSLSATRSSKVTSVPVEDGRSVSDHVVDMPVTLDLDAVVSNIWYDGVEKGRPESTYTLLVEMKKRRSLLSVQSMVGIFDNMLISDLSHTENSETGTSLHIKISMTEIKIAVSKESFEIIVADVEGNPDATAFARTTILPKTTYVQGGAMFVNYEQATEDYEKKVLRGQVDPVEKPKTKVPNNPFYTPDGSVRYNILGEKNLR